MTKNSYTPSSTSNRPKRKLLPLISLLALVGVALASPTAAASGNLPSEAAGALAIIVPVALLLTSLVYSVWKQTVQNATPTPEQFVRAHARASRQRR